MNFRTLAGGAALTALTLGMGAPALAQSTGSQAQEEEEIVVTAQRRSIDGAIVAVTVPKSRSTITSEFIDQQAAGQSVLQTINLVPGVNFTNSDPYGSSGGNLRLRSFDGNRVSLTVDGVPLNDTGNYAIFSNQQLDPELISRVDVNLGTTDVDSPTASAAGGTVNYVTRLPDEEFSVGMTGSIGEFNYYRAFGVIDTGPLGPLETTAFATASYTSYDKFKGPGEIEKQQYNGRLYQELGDGDFMSLAFHYNENRNNFYRNLSLRQISYYGEDFDNLPTCTRGAENASGVTNDGQVIDATVVTQAELDAGATFASTGKYLVTADNPLNPSSCTNYFGVRINPSNTGNIRGQGSFGLTDNLRLTIDPSFQYVLANGGGFTVTSERDDRLDLSGGNSGGAGVDLNGDGDVLDSIALFTPNNTNTRRYGLTSSVIWDLTDHDRMRLAYTFDYGRHRQTGEAGFLELNGDPEDVFAGKEGHGRRVVGVDGSYIRGRDRYSVALLNQFALEYRGQFFDDAVTVSLGVRVPMFERELNQFCFSQNQSSNVRCTTETPATVLPNGNVLFTATTTTQFLPPYRARFTFNDTLPNVGVSWRIFEGSSLYMSYAEGFSSPRTDNLYTVARGDTPTEILFSSAQPETTKAWDLGYRYQAGGVIGAVALWRMDYDNRIVSAFDDELNAFVDRNVGAVELQGVDAQIGVQAFDRLTFYASVSYSDSELQENIPITGVTFLPTAGKKLVETPDWTYSVRGDWDVTDVLSIGLQGKYVDDRFSTDVNDESTPSYTVWDLDARLDLNFINDDTYVQLNVTNLFDEDYLGSISSTNNALLTNLIGGGTRTGSAPLYSVGAPRSVMVTLRTDF